MMTPTGSPVGVIILGIPQIVMSPMPEFDLPNTYRQFDEKQGAFLSDLQARTRQVTPLEGYKNKPPTTTVFLEPAELRILRLRPDNAWRRLRKPSNWNVWRIITAALLMWTLLGMARSCTASEEPVKAEVQSEIDNRGYVKRVWQWSYSKLWQATPVAVQVKSEVDSRTWWVRFWSFGYVVIAAGLFWLAVEWDTARQYCLALFTILACILYSVSPVNLIPDFIPGIGGSDDAAVDIVGGGLALASIQAVRRQKRERELLIKLAEASPKEAYLHVMREMGIVAEHDPH